MDDYDMLMLMASRRQARLDEVAHDDLAREATRMHERSFKLASYCYMANIFCWELMQSAKRATLAWSRTYLLR